MWVKICANTNLADALLAAELGADAVGFVFAQSRRRVTPEQVAAITPLLPEPVERIGVFDRGSSHEILAAAETAGLTGIQLHGAFSPDLYADLDRENDGRFTLLRVLHWHSSAPEAARSLAEQVRTLQQSAPEARVLLDTAVAGAKAGGTGVPFAWAEAASVLAPVRGDSRLIVAGGLRSDNVAQAIRALTPWGVDVASGVEAAPGIKDPEKLRGFFREARAAFSSRE